MKDLEIKGFDNCELLDWNGLFVVFEIEYMVLCLILFGKLLYWILLFIDCIGRGYIGVGNIGRIDRVVGM